MKQTTRKITLDGKLCLVQRRHNGLEGEMYKMALSGSAAQERADSYPADEWFQTYLESHPDAKAAFLRSEAVTA